MNTAIEENNKDLIMNNYNLSLNPIQKRYTYLLK